ncbi:MAG: hypothetical protein ABR569_03735 [Gaiellaceae bacterium]
MPVRVVDPSQVIHVPSTSTKLVAPPLREASDSPKARTFLRPVKKSREALSVSGSTSPGSYFPYQPTTVPTPANVTSLIAWRL